MPKSAVSTNQSISKVERGRASSRVRMNMTGRKTRTIRLTARAMLNRSGSEAKRQMPR